MRQSSRQCHRLRLRAWRHWNTPTTIGLVSMICFGGGSERDPLNGGAACFPSKSAAGGGGGSRQGTAGAETRSPWFPNSAAPGPQSSPGAETVAPALRPAPRELQLLPSAWPRALLRSFRAASCVVCRVSRVARCAKQRAPSDSHAACRLECRACVRPRRSAGTCQAPPVDAGPVPTTTSSVECRVV